LTDEAQEREIENSLTTHIMQFLLELGAGFAFVGRQYRLEIDKRDFYIDLLFYHLKLRCYVAIELKTGEFKPEFAGKINFYLSALDTSLKASTDNPSIGIILCKNKSKIFAEYALRNLKAPIGVSEYRLTTAIPQKFKTSLPSITEIEQELSQSSGPKYSKRRGTQIVTK
jgi:hypothetical protein